jgi:S-phase kinase-associated protein 1
MKAKSSDDIDEWDREFINVDQGTLFEIILAANYLDMQGLLDLGMDNLGNSIGIKLSSETDSIGINLRSDKVSRL